MGAYNAEVERARAFLQRLNASMPEDHDLPCGDASDSSVTAWFDEPASGASHTASTRSLHWHTAPDINGSAGLSGSIDVPSSVAKLFGKRERLFDSYDSFRSSLDQLQRTAAHARIQSLMQARERCSSTVRDRLISEGFSPEQSQESVYWAQRLGLIDDARFADSFINTKIRAGWGRARIERELASYDIDPYTLVPDYPDAFFDAEVEYARASRALVSKAVPARNPVEKLARFLVNRGFSYHVAFSAARERVSSTGMSCDTAGGDV